MCNSAYMHTKDDICLLVQWFKRHDFLTFKNEIKEYEEIFGVSLVAYIPLTGKCILLFVIALRNLKPTLDVCVKASLEVLG